MTALTVAQPKLSRHVYELRMYHVNPGKMEAQSTIASSRSMLPKMLKTHTVGLAKREPRNTNGMAIKANMAVTRSPNAAG